MATAPQLAFNENACPPIACKLCGSSQVEPAYREEWRGQEYAGFYCRRCDVYQTLGNVADVSPHYHSLTEDELSVEHLFLMGRAHKAPAFRQWQGLMERHGPLAGNVLDIGCGIGSFLDFAAERGLSCYGFDASAAQIAQGKWRHPRVAPASDLAGYLRREPVSFRYVTMWDVLEHIPEPLPMLRAIRDSMEDESLLYVSVPSGATIPMKQAYYRLTGKTLSLCPWEHVFYYTPDSLRAVLTRAGFDVVEIGGVATYERPLSAQEAFRRIVTKGLSRTRYALQLYAVARRSHQPIRQCVPVQ